MSQESLAAYHNRLLGERVRNSSDRFISERKENEQTYQLKKGNQHSFQIKISSPFASQMTLLKFKEGSFDQGETNIVIENIGPGGLRFLSNLKLKEDQEVIYSFESEVIGEKIQLSGVIIWIYELTGGLYQYGVHFKIPENQRTFLTQLLNDYSQKYF